MNTGQEIWAEKVCKRAPAAFFRLDLDGFRSPHAMQEQRLGVGGGVVGILRRPKASVSAI
jgi:hypothetical protein